jgi:hypothetical protein
MGEPNAVRSFMYAAAQSMARPIRSILRHASNEAHGKDAGDLLFCKRSHRLSKLPLVLCQPLSSASDHRH